MIQFVSNAETLLQLLGKTLGTGDDYGDQDVIDKFLRVRQENPALPFDLEGAVGQKMFYTTLATIHVVVLHLFTVHCCSIDEMLRVILIMG